jgi:hypothetical protein
VPGAPNTSLQRTRLRSPLNSISLAAEMKLLPRVIAIAVALLVALGGLLALLAIPQLLEFNSINGRPAMTGDVVGYTIFGLMALLAGLGLTAWLVRSDHA